MTTNESGESSTHWTELLAMIDQIHGYNLRIMDVIATPRMKKCSKTLVVVIPLDDQSLMRFTLSLGYEFILTLLYAHRS
jgi:hypothetical protein